MSQQRYFYVGDFSHRSCLSPLFRGQAYFRGWGFSLVEIMVVLVIIGLLAGAVTVGTRNYLVKAKQNTAHAEIATICSAIDTFYSIYDRYPTNEEGLAVLMQKTSKLPDPLLQQQPIDPWGRAYQYNQPGRNGAYEVFSFGSDGREGGTPGSGEEDIGNWSLKESSQ
ncbi:MAG: type II secretion system major pseudopilin GspG [Phycisphaeraceae bacterium]|nr:type II secretion system major pseudopilin GspG [Phycisphaeraceae bacterium]